MSSRISNDPFFRNRKNNTGKQTKKGVLDEEIESNSEDEGLLRGKRKGGFNHNNDNNDEIDGEVEVEETPQEKRVRLALGLLHSVRQELSSDEYDVDGGGGSGGAVSNALLR